MSERGITLTFHGIGVPPSGVPDDERRFWIAPDRFEAFVATAGAKSRALGIDLMLTFDDGNRSDLEVAAPLLARHRLPGTFFPCTGRLGKQHYLDEQDLRRLVGMGFEVGSHGVDHVAWTTLSPADLEREVAGSKKRLEQVLARPVRAAAIPFGLYNRRVLAALKGAGYKKVYSSDRGLGNHQQWRTPRWTYVAGEPFTLERLAEVSGSLRYRTTVGLKGLVKAWR